MDLSLIYIFFLVLSISSVESCILQNEMQIHIINRLPPNSPQLKLHCASKGNDLGERLPAIDEDINWSVCEGFFFNEVYFCKFWWGTKEKGLQVYNDPFYCVEDSDDYNHVDNCKWEVRKDGFYLQQTNHTDGSYYMYHYLDWS
ncbi:hypothetical protein FXO38_30668 [Capsicum annuum]|uniref:S-protein homolog n=1 Tax=Capsicum annuum TaxID=4072 RepID=A0A2G2ZH32_CAPAN|nr:hypothetical protein FXO38_30668 [Capsicum annuum]KAF3679573.1 hypothetical protein FXO37_03792 [Capsicum annuum]PHT81244.1 hypothetical protein T459_14259 [Capsicum annuum]